MPLEAVEAALEEFVSVKDHRVIALKGQWGRGKSYFWRRFLANRAAIRGEDKRSYSYVSLFGLSTLAEFRDALFEGAVPISAVQPPGTSGAGAPQQLGTRLRTLTHSSRKLLDFAEKLPKLGELGPFARALAFQAVSDYVVCVDDLERRAESLSIREILGLVTMLREQRGCRVIVILNTDALSPEDRREFETLREKTFDYEIAFDPSATECAEIVFGGGPDHYRKAIELATSLSIANLRVLLRIRRLIDTLSPELLAAADEVRAHILNSAVLLGWCYNTMDGSAPDYEYVKGLSFGYFLDFGLKEEERTEQQKEWNALLSSYGYKSTDELDRSIGEVLERGFADKSRLQVAVANRSEAARKERLELAFSDAWGIYHGGFGSDEDELVRAFERSVMEGAEVISLINASAVTGLLRSLGHEKLADKLMDHWIRVQAKKSPRELNLRESLWRADVRDPKLAQAAQDQFDAIQPPTRSVGEILNGIVKTKGWSESDIEILGAASVDDYYSLFHSLSGEDTRAIAHACLRFEQMGPNPIYPTIGRTARAALIRIGTESPLNRRRVTGLGIEIPDK
jgi:hypothetical protein